MSANRRINGMRGAQKGAQVFRQAARWLERRPPEYTRGACSALVMARRGAGASVAGASVVGLYCERLAAIFKEPSRAWWGMELASPYTSNGGLADPATIERAHNGRILMLCFAAAMAETGDL